MQYPAHKPSSIWSSHDQHQTDYLMDFLVFPPGCYRTFQMLFQVPSKLPQCTWRMTRPHNMVPCGSCQAIHTGPYTFDKVILPECFMTLQDSQAVCYMLSLKIILWISWRIFRQHLQEFWYPPYSAYWPHHVYSKPEWIHYPTQLNFHFFWTYLNRFVFPHL
jgi:hypothetical protein